MNKEYRFDGPTKFRFSKTVESHNHKVRLDVVENVVKGLSQ
ncbi:hypothetical protein ACNO7K_04020 [Bisgaard Taxon 45]